jgi:hypothetical protein
MARAPPGDSAAVPYIDCTISLLHCAGRAKCQITVVSLYWLSYHVSGGPVGVVIIKAPDPLQARFRAAVEGLDQGNDATECHELEPDFAALIPRNMIGRRLPVAEAAKLLRLLDWSDPIPKRPPAPSIRESRCLPRSNAH